ncbi:hypothetical protein [Absidia glauca]|uniref:Uncharacterized protein n=1 Tax=Absidia glauca TaxID=4829 RepID=A0A163K690_ABSGL|nr:hypothetical protein [Absidia glauca]
MTRASSILGPYQKELWIIVPYPMVVLLDSDSLAWLQKSESVVSLGLHDMDLRRLQRTQEQLSGFLDWMMPGTHGARVERAQKEKWTSQKSNKSNSSGISAPWFKFDPRNRYNSHLDGFK